MTTYDEIYGFFTRNTKVDSLDFPTSIQEQYELIKDARIEFNIRLGDNLQCDDVSETVSEKLTDGKLMFLAECMKLITLKNMLTDFVSLWETFQNDVGRRYYRDQKTGRERLVDEQEKRLTRLALMIVDDFELEV